MSANQDNAEKWVDSTTDLIESYRQLISMRLVQHSSLGISIGVISILCIIPKATQATSIHCRSLLPYRRLCHGYKQQQSFDKTGPKGISPDA